MAATNVKLITRVGDRLSVGQVGIYQGTGAIAATDALVIDTRTYPIGTRYIDTQNGNTYERLNNAGAIGDWYRMTVTQLT